MLAQPGRAWGIQRANPRSTAELRRGPLQRKSVGGSSHGRPRLCIWIGRTAAGRPIRSPRRRASDNFTIWAMQQPEGRWHEPAAARSSADARAQAMTTLKVAERLAKAIDPTGLTVTDLFPAKP